MSNIETINICVAADNNYAQHAGVVIASALANSKDDEKICAYVLNGGIAEENKQKLLDLKNIKDCEINIIDVDESLFEDYKTIQTHAYISLPSYFRLKLASMLPKVDKIIYFDCDIVVNSSLKELFNTDLNGYAIGGAQDINRKMVRKNPHYVNAGMLILNLDEIRKNNFEDKFLNYTREHKDTITMGDQEILNNVCNNSIKIVNETWNVQSSNFINRSSYTATPKVIHFVAKRKPWHWASFSVHRNLYFKYLQMTDWKLSDKEYKHWTRDNQIASLFLYVYHRPLFFLRIRYYEALFKVYLKPLFGGKA